MVNLVVGGIVATVAVIALGTLYTLPPYIMVFDSSQKVPHVLLSLSITSDQNTLHWCQGMAELLNENKLKAIVFFSGKIAEQYPDCVKSFGDQIDIGSSTYSFTKLSTPRDYLEQLEDIRAGKRAVDTVADIYSKSFKAPYGLTDGNIYSLLSRNDIVADFSGNNSYNKYENDQFIFYELKTYDLSRSNGSEIESDIAKKVADTIQITADNSVPIEKVTLLVTNLLHKQQSSFVNASDVIRMDLTVRRE